MSFGALEIFLRNRHILPKVTKIPQRNLQSFKYGGILDLNICPCIIESADLPSWVPILRAILRVIPANSHHKIDYRMHKFDKSHIGISSSTYTYRDILYPYMYIGICTYTYRDIQSHIYISTNWALPSKFFRCYSTTERP